MKRPFQSLLATATLVTSVLVVHLPAAADPGQVVRADGPTFVYNATLANIVTRVQAVSLPNGRTIFTLDVSGMPAQYIGATFGAHVHVSACGSSPSAAGGHYASPDANPSVPLEQREVWLDFTVDEAGAAHAKATRPFHIAAGGANAVVIHALPTNPGTGAAGPRLACTTVPFGAPTGT